jgi:hypothetical protein
MLGCYLGADAICIRLIEIVDYGLIGVFYVCPILARELREEMDHGSERGTVLEFVGVPCVPVRDRVHGTFEIDFVHHLRTVLGVCPVPEKTSLLDDHFEDAG